jgi:hypothetical protein
MPLPTDPIANALLVNSSLDALTAQFSERIRADFARHLAEYALEDGMGFTLQNRYNALAERSMRFSASYRYGTGDLRGRLVYSAQIDNAKVERVAREDAIHALLAWHKKLLGKFGTVDACTLCWMNGANIDMQVRKGDAVLDLRQRIVWKYTRRAGWFPQFPARLYVNGKFTPEAEVKAMFAA